MTTVEDEDWVYQKNDGAGNKLLYFAYGSNMLSCRLRAPCRTPSSVFLDTGFVEGRKLTFDKVSSDNSGKCDIEFTGNPSVKAYGVLYSGQSGRPWKRLRRAGHSRHYSLGTRQSYRICRNVQET